MPEYIETKSILSKLRQTPDPYFGITYSMNLYRGCQHQCIYCDSRSTVYRLGNLANIRVKRNGLDLLDAELKSKRIKGTLGTGSMNDPYMSIEADERMTRGAMELICKHRFPVHIMTKSDLVTRDSDILQDIKTIYAAVSLTITTPNDPLSKIIEPGAPHSSKRFTAMSKLAQQGMYTGVIITPVLPYITDNAESIRLLLTKAKDSGAKYALCWMGMTQREGQREYYYAKLDDHFPGLRNKYISQYSNSYSCAVPNSFQLQELFMETCQKIDLEYRMDFYQQDNPRQLNLF